MPSYFYTETLHIYIVVRKQKMVNVPNSGEVKMYKTKSHHLQDGYNSPHYGGVIGPSYFVYTQLRSLENRIERLSTQYQGVVRQNNSYQAILMGA